MPRSKCDSVSEKRFTLGNYERSQFNDALTAYKNKSYIQGIATGIGGISLGTGVLLAGWAYMKFKAPDVQEEVKDFVFGALDSTADALFPSTPIQFRREAQALAKERGRIAKAESVYCSFSSEKYDQALCSSVQQEKDAYFEALKAFQEKILQVTGPDGDLNTASNTWYNFIFGGLGDIDPNKDSNPNNDDPYYEDDRSPYAQ